MVITIGTGLILGSFLSVLIGRWPQWRGVVAGRSECPHCHHGLAWYDLVPLVSWVVLRGRCRYCSSLISSWYPVYELTLAVLFGWYAWQYGLDVLELSIIFGLVALFFFDLKYQVLPDVIVFPLMALAVLRLGTTHSEFSFWGPVAGIIFFAFFWVLYRLSRGRWLGFGDVKLALAMGLLFGRGVVGVTLIALWSGAAIGVILMVLGRATRKTPLPFGSFWSAAAMMTLLWPAPAYALSRLFLSYGIN